MKTGATQLVLCSVAAAILLASCTILSPTADQVSPGGETEAPQVAGSLPGFESWQDVLDQASGSSVNWYMWGGSAAINEFVDTFYGDVLSEEFGVTLNRVPVADTVDAVNLVISEAEAGLEAGSIDLIWINGENFFTLRQADLLYGPWAEGIPNSALVDWENPALAFDFGVPVEGYESPWSSAQFHFIYDTARMGAGELPRTYDELDAWIRDNPGRFTYIAPGPGAFQGTRFVKQVLYAVSGGSEQWVGEWDPALYEQHAPALWEKLNGWEPHLWREGETYPATVNELHQLFANREVDFTITQAPAGAGPAIASGLIPDTARAFAFDEYLIGDYKIIHPLIPLEDVVNADFCLVGGGMGELGRRRDVAAGVDVRGRRLHVLVGLYAVSLVVRDAGVLQLQALHVGHTPHRGKQHTRRLQSPPLAVFLRDDGVHPVRPDPTREAVRVVDEAYAILLQHVDGDIRHLGIKELEDAGVPIHDRDLGAEAGHHLAQLRGDHAAADEHHGAGLLPEFPEGFVGEHLGPGGADRIQHPGGRAGTDHRVLGLDGLVAHADLPIVQELGSGGM